MSHSSFSVGDPLKNWSFKKWLAKQLSQPSPSWHHQSSGSDGREKYLPQGSNIDMFQMENSKPIFACKIAIYVIQALQILTMLAICVVSAKPILNLTKEAEDKASLQENLRMNENYLWVGLIILVRALSSLVHILLSKNNCHYMANKIVQLGCLILFKVPLFSFLFPFFGLVCLIEYVSDLVYILCKEQRRGYADSRLDYNCYITRMFGSSICVVLFNIIMQQYSTAIMIFLLIIAVVHTWHIASDTLYSLATRNFLVVMWLAVVFNIFYFLLLIYAPVILVVNFLINRWVSWALSPLVTIGAAVILYLNRTYVAFWSFTQFSILQQDFYELKNSEQKSQYIWQAVRFLTITPQGLQYVKQTVWRIDWVLKKYPSLDNQIQSKKTPTGRSIYVKFYNKFSSYCYKILMENFKQSEENKYLLIFFFNELSAERLLFYLNKTDFYDIRERERIQREHRSSDIAGKVHEMMKNQAEIARVLKLYIKKLRLLAEIIGDEEKAVDILLCQQLGEELIKLQQQILKFGPEDQFNDSRGASEMKQLKAFQNPQVLSAYSFNLLNSVRRQMLGAAELPRSKCEAKIQEISQIMNQESSLIVISAQAGQEGMILGVNPAASRLTCYLQEQLIGQCIDMILPHKIQSYISAMHKTGAFSMSNNPDDDYNYQSMTYILRKNKYCALCTLSLRFLDCSVGKRWILKLHQVQSFSIIVICDRDQSIIGFSEAAIRIGMEFDLLGINLAPHLAMMPQKNEEGLKSKQSSGNETPRRAILRLKQMLTSSIEGRISESRFQQILNLNQFVLSKAQSNQNQKIQSISGGIQCTILSKTAEHSPEYSIIKFKDRKKDKADGSFTSQDQMKLFSRLKQKQKHRSKQKQKQNQNQNQKQKEKQTSIVHSINVNQTPKKKHRKSINSLKNQFENVQYQNNQFQFHYDPSQHMYSNSSCKPGQEDWTGNNMAACSQQEQNYNKESPIVRATTINFDDINELIFLNGELQCRENKKLQQRHTCETHPIHLNYRFDNESSEAVISNPIEGKNKIYEIIGPATKDKGPAEAPQSFYYLKQHKILLTLLIIFMVLGCSVTLVTILCVNDASQHQSKKMTTTLLMSQRSQLYTNLANSMTTYILINIKLLLNSSYLANRPNLSMIDVLGAPDEWLSLVKEVESKSSLINSIDSIQEQWKILNLGSQIPQLSGLDLSTLLDETFVDLLQLQQLCETYPQVNLQSVGNVTQLKVNSELLTNALLVLQKLVEKVIPLNLFLVSKSQQIYETSIMNLTKVILVCVLIFIGIAIIITMISFCQLNRICKQIKYNLELFTFFPTPSIEAFIGKLNEFDAKINDQIDLTTQIGMEKQNQAQFVEEELIFHKRKIKKNIQFNNFAAFSIVLIFIPLGLGLLGLIFHLIKAVQSPTNLDNWFAISNSRLLELNYQWQPRIIQEGRVRLAQINSYFESKGLDLIPIELLIKNRQYTNYQTQHYRNIYTNQLSFEFQKEISDLLDSKYCYVDELTLSAVPICNGHITNFSIDSLEGYLELKRYSLEVLLHQSLQQKSYEQFSSLANFFSQSNGIINDERLLNINQEIVERELQRSQSQNYINMIIGFLVLLCLSIMFSIAYVREVHNLTKKVYAPILILVKCFPLLMLNRNQPFLKWLHKNKLQELR